MAALLGRRGLARVGEGTINYTCTTMHVKYNNVILMLKIFTYMYMYKHADNKIIHTMFSFFIHVGYMYIRHI